VVGDRIYYINVSDGGKLYTIKTDGSDRRLVD
jgi:tricorn protease-like protein